MKKYYLAYGSNLNLSNMNFRCPDAVKVGTFNLKDYRLIFKGGEGTGYLTIEPFKDSIVPLGIYQVDSKDFKALDIYEGYPDFYSKEIIHIKVNGKKKKGIIYVMNDEFIYNIPSISYLETCIQGYKDFGFDNKTLIKALTDTLNIISKREYDNQENPNVLIR